MIGYGRLRMLGYWFIEMGYGDAAPIKKEGLGGSGGKGGHLGEEEIKVKIEISRYNSY